jgi:hypothetical protein
VPKLRENSESRFFAGVASTASFAAALPLALPNALPNGAAGAFAPDALRPKALVDALAASAAAAADEE